MYRINKKSRIIENYSLLLIDMLCVIGSYLIALLLRFGTVRITFARQEHYLVCVGLVLGCVLYNGLSDWNRGFFERGNLVELISVVRYNAIVAIAMGCIIFMSKMAEDYSRLTFGYFVVINTVLTCLIHTVFKYCMLNFYRKSTSSDKVMIITEDSCTLELMEKVLKNKAWNYEITAIAIVDKNRKGEEIEGIPVVASGEDLFEVSRRMMLDEVFMYLPHTKVAEVKEMLLDLESMGIVCHYNVEVPELNLKGKVAGNFAGYAVMTFSLQYMDYRKLLIKRTMDIVGGIIGLLLTAVLTPFVAAAIKIESKGPVFFSQTRVGKNGRLFKIYKFRSMYQDAEERKKQLEEQNEMKGLMFKIENDPRITKVGRWIRKLSIDELPQFYNVLIGEMSLVGTRPPTLDEFERYNMGYRRRLCITPGLTGMWQVSGRSDITDFDEVVKLDFSYIDNWSLLLDLKILAKTLGVVVFGKGSR